MLAAKTVAAPVLPNRKSASGVTVVVTGGVTLFVGVGSGVGEPVVAKFVNVPLAGGVTVTVTLLTWLLTSVPKFHVTTPELFVPPPVALTKFTLLGNASVTVTLLAVDGPKFVTLMV